MLRRSDDQYGYVLHLLDRLDQLVADVAFAQYQTRRDAVLPSRVVAQALKQLFALDLAFLVHAVGDGAQRLKIGGWQNVNQINDGAASDRPQAGKIERSHRLLMLIDADQEF